MSSEYIVIERGNGFPDAGEIIYCGDSGTYYRVQSISNHIHTGRLGNYVYALLVEAGDDEADSDDLRNLRIEAA